ncbi:MAG TPA: TetR/AcrR family transcriptional regulator [Propionibacterium sp.]|nr:TetR/AcrR family transcriptional regulator [Propionibacterium sp.]
MNRVRTYPEDLRDRLVAEAFRRLQSHDPEDVSLRDLAMECDTSTNAIYSIFGNKDALIESVAGIAREDFLRPQFDLLDLQPSIDVLAASGQLYRSWAKENPGLYRLMFGGNPTRLDLAPRAQMVEPIRLLLERLQADGVLLPHDSGQTALSLWASIHGFVMLELNVWTDGAVDLDSLFVAHLSNCAGRIIAPAVVA